MYPRRFFSDILFNIGHSDNTEIMACPFVSVLTVFHCIFYLNTVFLFG